MGGAWLVWSRAALFFDRASGGEEHALVHSSGVRAEVRWWNSRPGS